jgi:alanine dehydrogenase
MISLDAARIADLLDYPATIAALRTAFAADYDAPPRHHHHIASGDGAPEGTMLLMPAWASGRYLGVKVVNVFAQNAALGLPAVQGVYLLFSGRSGAALAMLEGGELTARRTAAASALAASHLARPDARRLLIVGTGRLAAHLATAHATIRPLRAIAVWGRDPARAAAVAAGLAAQGLPAAPASDLEAAVAQADIISCATLSRTRLIRGDWLRAGTHLDLVGGFTPAMRETDDAAIRRASLFIDTEAALGEAGDIAAPLAAGLIGRGDIRADLAALVRGTHPGRIAADEITLFKSVGAAIEDLAAAILAYERATLGAGAISAPPRSSG